jgi:hypothetical protein
MKYKAQFDYPESCKMILRDSYEDNTYYGLDDFDCKYIRILQAKFGCLNSFHTIPDRVKMEMAQFEWSKIRQRFVLRDKKTKVVQLNRLETMVVSYSVTY